MSTDPLKPETTIGFANLRPELQDAFRVFWFRHGSRLIETKDDPAWKDSPPKLHEPLPSA